MIRTTAAICATLVLLTAGCGKSGSSSTTPSATAESVAPVTTNTAQSAVACTPPRAHSPGDSAGTIESGGLTRSYLLHVPAAYDGTHAAPLVLALHPFGAPAAFFAAEANFPAVADPAGAVIVAPEGTGDPQFWNVAAYAAAPDDVAFLRDLIARLDTDLCIDPARTYAAGSSAGGGMAMRLACAMPDRIAAIGVVASLYLGDCQADVPMIAFHGTRDLLVPFEGGPGAVETVASPAPVRRSVSEWARAASCDGLAQISRVAPDVELSTFLRCRPGSDVLLYTVVGGGHSWPGAQPPLPESIAGVTTQEIRATSLIWNFFMAHPRAP